MAEQFADSLLGTDPYYRKIFSTKENYWIITHANRNVYGPLMETEYLQQRRRLNIPNEVFLE
jgi:hypothetical protein